MRAQRRTGWPLRVPARITAWPALVISVMLTLPHTVQPRTAQAHTTAPPAPKASTNRAAPAVTLASGYHPGVDLQQYWVSEKYDGVRAVWDGQQLRTRQGHPIAAPAWFTQGWPRTAWDGELWAGRGRFAQVQATIAQANAPASDWHALRYMVFDVPQHPGSFAQRLPILQAQVTQLGQRWVQAAPQWREPHHAALMATLRQRTAAGAEGLMLRRSDAPYRAGRSDDLLKLKLHDDAEAVVLAHLPGQGKYRGMTGALLVQMPSGQQFKLGSGLSDADRAAPPPVGSTVTYRFNGHHPSGLPRFARYWRPRPQ